MIDMQTSAKCDFHKSIQLSGKCYLSREESDVAPSHKDQFLRRRNVLLDHIIFLEELTRQEANSEVGEEGYCSNLEF